MGADQIDAFAPQMALLTGAMRPLNMCRFIQRVRSQLPECDAQSLTQLALGLSVLGPKLSTGWMAAFVRALQRQPTALDLQVQVRIMRGERSF